MLRTRWRFFGRIKKEKYMSAKAKFSQKDYLLYLSYYDKVLEVFKKELEEGEKNGRKPLIYYRTQKTFEHLTKERGKNLTPYDVDNIVYVLLHQIKKQKE